MRGRSRWAACVVAAMAMAGCGPRTTVDEWAGLAHPDLLAKAGLKYYWRSKVPLDEGESVRRIWRLDENLYCLTSRNRLIAVDAANSRVKWSYAVAHPRDTVFPPVHADSMLLTPKVSGIAEILTPEKLAGLTPFDAVLLNTLSRVFVLDRSSGVAYREGAAIELRGFVANTAGATDGMFYVVGSPDGVYHLLNLQDGVRHWMMTTSTRLEPIDSPIRVFDGRIYAANEGGGLYCSLVGRAERHEWSHQLDGAVTGAMHIDNRGCFVPCWDHRVYAFNPATGDRLWDPFICDGSLQRDIQVGEASIFAYAEKDKLYCLDVATGRLRWSLPEGRVVLTVLDGQVFLKDDRNNLVLVDEMLGKQRESVPLTGLEMLTPSTSAPAIYAARADGRVFCLTPVQTRLLTSDMLRGRKAPPAK